MTTLVQGDTLKITTVVPAYKPQFLKYLLASLMQQTERPHQVIFSDDTEDLTFARALLLDPLKTALADLNVKVVQGPRKGAAANWRHCLQAWDVQTELVHVLCDDDYLFPQFYEQHRKAHESGRFSATVSRRYYADIDGVCLQCALEVPPEIASVGSRYLRIDAATLFPLVVPSCTNWLGEVSNMVMHREAATLLAFPSFDGIPFSGLEDIGSVLCASVQDPICYIAEHLGYFRMHPQQNTMQFTSRPVKLAVLAWGALAVIGRQRGLLNHKHAKVALAKSLFMAQEVFAADAEMKPFIDLIPAALAEQPQALTQWIALWNGFAAQS
ncbi:glycosyltransferase family 2 protein [Rhodoferax aquaticus]|uniref:Glycosyltransferase family 2 protein n=1 Tax=Rhodoferax aquaticus TaxID=2527691 RepID=A0A515EV50_9BURK|nr:glycosyltransferase family A protein [Rhodoferax aquaticus]QDL56561.1 glycosyltransferase family 2 protein [Rhodoferax aquaticus]